MINKSLVKKRFSKSLKTYNDNAVIQKIMAEKLINLLPDKEFSSIFEIGCATGILTEQIAKNLTFKTFTANDLVENSKEYIDKIIPENTFISGDIEKIKINRNYDLIIANAALQWCENQEKIINKLYSKLNDNGVLAVSIFANNNLNEIKTVLNLQETINTNLSGITEEYKIFFKSPLEVLKHIKSTGANSLTEYKFTKTSLNAFEKKYNDLYSQNGKVSLTYRPLYIIKIKK